MKRYYAQLTHLIFWNFIKHKSVFSKKKKRILVSIVKSPAWKENFVEGFRYSKYRFDFGPINAKTIKNYDCVVPLSFSDMFYADGKRHLIPDNPFPFPGKRSIQLCDDKFLFNNVLINNGYEDYVPSIGIEGTYPYILKKKSDVGGENSHIINDIEDEKKVKHLLKNPNYFTQELIIGKHEYVTHILFKNKRIVKSLNIKYTFNSDMPIKGQDVALYTKICGCSYLELFSSILNSINFEGICNIGYKMKNNRPMIIEINPRVGYSLSKYFFTFVEKVLN